MDSESSNVTPEKCKIWYLKDILFFYNLGKSHNLMCPSHDPTPQLPNMYAFAGTDKLTLNTPSRLKPFTMSYLQTWLYMVDT